MPITQERIRKILDAAGQYQQAYLGICGNVKDEYHKCRRGEADAMESLTMLAAIADYIPSGGADATLAIEELRYKFTHSRNHRAKMRKRIQRTNFAQSIERATEAIRAGTPMPRTAAQIAAELDLEEDSIPAPEGQRVEPPPPTAEINPAIDPLSEEAVLASYRGDPENLKAILREVDQYIAGREKKDDASGNG